MNKSINIFELIWKCIKLSWASSKKYTVMRTISKFLVPINAIIISYLSKLILDSLSLNITINYNIYTLLIINFLIVILNMVLNKIVNYITILHEDIIDKEVDNGILKTSLESNIELFDNPEFYNRLTSVKNDSIAIARMIWNILDGISALIACAVTCIILFKTNYLYGVILICSAIPAAYKEYKYTKSLYFMNKEQINKKRQLTYVFNLAVDKNYALDTRLFKLKNTLLSKYNNVWIELFNTFKLYNGKKTKSLCFFSILPEIAKLAILYNLINNINNKINTIGDFSLYTALLQELMININIVVSNLSGIYENKLKLTNVFSFIENASYTCTDQYNEEYLETCLEITSIKFEHVFFSYPGNDKMILNDLSFEIRCGEKVALVGVNGSGKSTIIKLILRFYDVVKGKILINNKEITFFSKESIRRCFTVYFQNELNYAFTIKENIQISDIEKRDKLDDTSIIKLLEVCGFKNINQLPKGLLTQISRKFEPNGIEISGGENQKIALARTFYRSCSAALFDEPSSSLDPESEYKIFDYIEKEYKNKIVLFTSHRLSNIYLAQKIIVIENGVVIEEGTLDELLNCESRFKKMYSYQTKKFRLHEEIK